MRFRTLPLIIVLFLFSSQLHAQTILIKQSYFFKSGYFNLSKYKVAKLNRLIENIKENSSVSIVLEGNSDNVGNYLLNKKLSERRALSIKKYLITKGIEENVFDVKVNGSDKPIDDNKTFKGRTRNRRVDLVITKNEVVTTSINKVDNILDLYKQLETPLQKFCINRYRDTSIRCKQGTVIHVKANTFSKVGNCGDDCVSFGVKEAYLKSDMILDNLTTTSDDALIETQGMVYTEALDCNEQKLVLNKDLIILMPTDSIRADAKIFDGNRDHNDVMNWTINNNAVLSSFNLDELDYCNNILCGHDVVEDVCERCKFFFCRIGRIGKATKGIFDKNTRMLNKQFRQCQQKLKKKSIANQNSNQQPQNSIVQQRKNDSARLDTCENLKALFKKYGVKNLEGLILAINKPLLDKYKVATMNELRDTMEKENIQKIELAYMDKTISFTDYKYYIFNTSKLGWSNVDCFADLSRWELVKVKVNLAANSNIDCKLVFKKRRAIMPATKAESRYEFKGVPRGEEAWIVSIKYEDGKPFMAIRDITIHGKTYDIEFKELTLGELKEKLRLLNQ